MRDIEIASSLLAARRFSARAARKLDAGAEADDWTRALARESRAADAERWASTAAVHAGHEARVTDAVLRLARKGRRFA